MENSIHGPRTFQTQRTTLFLLLAVVALAAGLRLIGLGTLPPGLFSDEASTGYDAFCLLRTGRDQFGEFLPLFARSLGDYNEALYRYLCIPSIYLFGLNEFAVRLPAALAGTGTVLLLYFLCRPCFGSACALLCSLLLAVSPWHILLSRVAFRASLLPFFICLGWLLLEKSRQGKWLLLGSSASFAVALYTYSPARLIVPAMILVLAIHHRHTLKGGKTATLAAVLLGLTLALPALKFFGTPAAWERSGQVLHLHWKDNLLFYYSYFSPEFLFFDGDPNLRHSLPSFGQLHHFELLTVPAGLALWWRHGRKSLPFWACLFIYPAAAALTAPWHALRGVMGSAIFAIASGCGILFLHRSVPPVWRGKVALLQAFLVTANVLFFLYVYIVPYPVRSAPYWLSGQDDAIKYVMTQKDRPVLISHRLHLPHIFVLFFDKYPPASYQASPVTSILQGNWKASRVPIGRFIITDLSQEIEGPVDPLVIATPPDLPFLKNTFPNFAISRTFGSGPGQSPVLLIETRAPRGNGPLPAGFGSG